MKLRLKWPNDPICSILQYLIIWYDSLSDSDKPEIKAQSGAAGGVERPPMGGIRTHPNRAMKNTCLDWVLQWMIIW